MSDLFHVLDGLGSPMLFAALVVVGAVEAAFPPFPGDAATVVCSFALARQGASLPLAIASSSLGSFIGGLALFAVGRRWAAHPTRARWADPRRFHRAQALVARWGVPLVLVSRFIPGIRSFILVAAGSAGLPPGAFATALAGAVLAWQSVVVGGGYLVGRSWLRVVRTVGNAGIAAAALACLAGYATWRLLRHRRASGGRDGHG